MSADIDRINQQEMLKASSVKHYLQDDDGLTRAEQAALDSVAQAARGRRILDIGMGTGRTVAALRQVSLDYLGVDNSHAMVAACRKRFPDVTFEHADAREMSNLGDASVHLAMFSCNGIGMVAHADRLRIMREVHRVLEPGGVFLFSTHNQNCPDHSAGFKLPELVASPNPVRMLVRLGRFSSSTLKRLVRRYRFRRFEVRNSEYSVINDVCHDYGVMLYYITLDKQREQLERMGFAPHAQAFGRNGETVHNDTPISSIMLIARKPLAA